MAYPLLTDIDTDPALAARVEGWQRRIHALLPDAFDDAALAALTHGRREGGDSLHLLAMDRAAGDGRLHHRELHRPAPAASPSSRPCCATWACHLLALGHALREQAMQRARGAAVPNDAPAPIVRVAAQARRRAEGPIHTTVMSGSDHAERAPHRE